MSFDQNTNPHPLEIEDVRDAQFKASQIQRDFSDALATAHRALADAEFRYRRALSDRTKELHVKGIPTGPSEGKGLAITTCENIAKGEESIALLRKERDERRGDVKAAEKECFRAGDDRKGLLGLMQWSMYRDLRVDAEPGDWSRQPTHGTGIPPRVDPATGELRAA